MTQSSKIYSITFLLDSTNNWIERLLRNEKRILNLPRFDIQISHNCDEVYNQDIVFILNYESILGEDFLAKNSLNLVVHASDLPHGKGHAPVQWQILEGKKKIPISIIEAAKHVDAGDIILKSTFSLTGYELYEEMREAQAKATFDIIMSFLDTYPDFQKKPQNGDGSYYPKRTLADSELDTDQSLREQFNVLRIGNNDNWPSYFIIDGHKYILKIEHG